MAVETCRGQWWAVTHDDVADVTYILTSVHAATEPHMTGRVDRSYEQRCSDADTVVVVVLL